MYTMRDWNNYTHKTNNQRFQVQMFVYFNLDLQIKILIIRYISTDSLI